MPVLKPFAGRYSMFYSYSNVVVFQVTSASSSPEKCLTCTRALLPTKTGILTLSTTQMLNMVRTCWYTPVL